MAKTYRNLQNWELWLAHFLGQAVIQAEQQFLASYVRGYGKHILLLGVPKQWELLRSSSLSYPLLLSPLMTKDKKVKVVESDFLELPISSGSVDLVVLPHTLEFTDHSQKLLTEACRIVKPEGHIIILGFNPYSFWGLKKLLAKNKQTHWSRHLIKPSMIKNWLKLSDFALIKQDMLLFTPPLEHEKMYRKFKFFERIGHKIFRCFGGVYVLVAQAKVIPLTPIKLSWKQSLSSVRVPPTSIPGSTRTIRNQS